MELPVTVLTGFLGAGKTTLLKDLVKAPLGVRLALILNELGQAGIDEAPEAAFLELSQGCVCCLRNPELVSALQELSARDDVDRVILETTGVADPLAITWTLARPELRGRARVDAVVTVVDPLAFAAVREEKEWLAQVESADLVVLSKSDVASAAQLEAARAAVLEVQPGVRVLPSAEVPPGLVLDIEGPRALELPERAHGRHSGFGVVSMAGGVYALDPLEDLLEDLPAAIFRAKGIVHLSDDRWAAFHAVGGRLDLRLGVPAPAHSETRMAFFGRALDETEVRARVNRARTSND